MHWIVAVILASYFSVVTAELYETTLTHPLFSFDTYPTLQDISDVQTQPIEITAPRYYSHVYGSLRSTVKGNITQLRYIPTTNSNISFQIWNMTAEGDPQIKTVLQVVPEVGGGDIKVAKVNVAIDVGDVIGVWVEHYYPVGMLRLYNQRVTDYFVVYNGWDSQIQPEDAGPTDIESVTMSASSRDSPAFMAAVEVTITYEVKAQPGSRSGFRSTRTANKNSGIGFSISINLNSALAVVVGVAVVVIAGCIASCEICCRLCRCRRKKKRTSQHPQPKVNRAYQPKPGRSNGAQAQVIQETDVKPRRNIDDNKKKQNITPRLCETSWHWDLGQPGVSLERDTAEFRRVHYKFHETCTTTGIKITEIVRLQNECLYTRYQAQKNKVEKELADHPSIVVERELWYGTTANSVRQICANGSDMFFAGKNGTAHGKGLYFSTTSQYSLAYSKGEGQRYMILAKVVTGRYQLGTRLTHASTPPQNVHSTVDNINNPTTFVVYNNAAAYPEYVIKFLLP